MCIKSKQKPISQLLQIFIAGNLFGNFFSRCFERSVGLKAEKSPLVVSNIELFKKFYKG